MNKIFEYKILEARTPSELEKFVANHINEGWQPLGGCVIARTKESQQPRLPGDDLFSYYQTIVLYEE